jgi:hypothetical protein
MAPPDDLSGILDRIANGEETEGDRQLLRQLLREKQSQSVVQLGKYTVNLGQGREIQVGDRIYQGADAETIKEGKVFHRTHHYWTSFSAPFLFTIHLDCLYDRGSVRELKKSQDFFYFRLN